MLKLMYITNNPEVALVAEKAGVDRIWIDLETIGKAERQKGYDSVKSHHSVDDIKLIAPQLTKAEMLVRVNPWHEKSKDEIEAVVAAGAEIIMLPYWKTPNEVDQFLRVVDGRARTTLLLETKEAVECVDDVLELQPDEIHIGLNDLHLSYHLTFMFELYTNGIVEYLAEKIRSVGIPFGIGGIGKFGIGLLPTPESVVIEQYRLGSTALILSRSFCNYQKLGDIGTIEKELTHEVRKLRILEHDCMTYTPDKFRDNKRTIDLATNEVVQKMKK